MKKASTLLGAMAETFEDTAAIYEAVEDVVEAENVVSMSGYEVLRDMRVSDAVEAFLSRVVLRCVAAKAEEDP